jgi:enoyl-CoA hydratase/carnithine racemase
MELPFQDALAVERELQQQLFQSEDAKEGLGAYNQRRKPSFAGK